MKSGALPFLTIAEAARLIQKRKLSPVELTQAVLARIEAVDPGLKTYITVMRAEAIGAAREAEREIQRGEYRGPLHGIPISLKDVIATKGVRTTCGSKILADWMPQYSAAAVERLEKAGAVIVGKSNTHEFAFGSTTTNPHFGTCRNPWDVERVPGGSSGGSAAAVVASLCLGSLGSDTGGSIRVPAAFCGVVGLRPTYGRVSCYGVFPVAWSLDTVGPIARTVEDAAIILRAIAGYDSKDPASANTPVPDYVAALDSGVKGLRIGVPREHFFEKSTKEVATLVRRAIETLETLGAQVKEVSLPLAKYCSVVNEVVNFTEPAAVHERWLKTRPQDYGMDVLLPLQVGALIPATYYHKAQRLRRLIQSQFRDVLKDVDAIISPTSPITAPRITGPATQGEKNEQSILGERAVLSSLTRPHGVAGLTAITVPCGFTEAGLPVGLQLATKPFNEATILRIAHAYEQATGWHKMRPSV